MRIGILTGGGDAPGLNAVIRAVVKTAVRDGAETISIENGFAGLIGPTHWRRLTLEDLPGILRRGGTILGTTNRHNPLAYPSATGGVIDYSRQCVETFRTLGLDALVVIGGDGTLAIAQAFHERGIPLVCVPKTIDNDIVETASTFGFDSAVSFATEAIDRLHTTAEAHHRVMVVEVMGRYTGWIALHAGVAGGADVVLIPEIPYDLDAVAHQVLERERLGARFSVVVVAEGATPAGGTVMLQQPGSASSAERLGGIGARLAAELEASTGKETRSVALGHLQRGGSPTSVDRLLATRFGVRAMELVLERNFGTMVALQPPRIMPVPLSSVSGRIRTVPLDCDLMRAARAIGVGFGDSSQHHPTPQHLREDASTSPKSLNPHREKSAPAWISPR
jgi:ATP-dependent phosphofructokinase / diphosphate-dependent phosphofructokinase